MKLTEEIKQAIIEEYNSFKDSMYAGKSKEERKSLDQFFTPPELTIAMIEKMDCDSLADKKILDPCCGSGNLLMACLIAGASPNKLYGNDYDKDMVSICRRRLKAYAKAHSIDDKRIQCFNYHIHQGNALQYWCLNYWRPDYNAKYNVSRIDDLKYFQRAKKPSQPGYNTPNF